MNRQIVALFCALIALTFTEGSELLAQSWNSRCARITEVVKPDLAIKEGYVSQKKETVKIIRNGKVVAKVKLGKPVLVAQAEQEEEWGYFQFPGIGRTEDGKLIASWQMNSDSHKAYGNEKSGYMMSSNEGRTWKPLDKECFILGSRMVKMKNGNILQVATPTSKDVNDYIYFPKPRYSDQEQKMDYFLESELPDDFRGVYLCLRDSKGKRLKSFRGVLNDPGLLRYDINNLMPVKWWGDIKELKDGSLVAGIYPSYYLSSTGMGLNNAITFYKSNDGGSIWNTLGRIFYNADKVEVTDRQYDKIRGFSEACFEILKDSTFFCVTRSGFDTPMFKSFSTDGGKHWSEPEAFTSNGVKPRLLLLDNGVMVLASGRPGLQLRFCLEGDGKVWTEPIEMLPFQDENGNYDMWGVSCGYPRLLKVDKDTFYMVYSNFITKNGEGEYRKSIMFRKITVTGIRK